MKKAYKLTTLVAVVLLLASIITGSIYLATNSQLARRDNPFSAETRRILNMNFNKTELGAKENLKRIINAQNPLNLLNYYGNEDISTLWGSIPDNQKPYTVMLIIPGHTLTAATSVKFLEESADNCERLKIPYAIQTINGEYHAEERMPISYIEERFAKVHKYFYGLNAAELYNSVVWRGEVESDNSFYLVQSIKLCAKYGAYFYWTDTNMNYNSGMVLEWFEKNELFYSTFKEYSKYIVLMNKESYGRPSTYSVMLGLWLAGLVGNWGIASDWWHWQVDGDKKSLFGENDDLVFDEWNMIMSYPEAMYVQSMMLGISNGATCFKAEAPNFSTSVGGVAVGGFRYGIEKVFNKILSGEIKIPSKQTLLDKTQVAFVGNDAYTDCNYNYDESNLFPANGAYGIIPLLPTNLRKAEKQIFMSNNIELLRTKVSKEYLDSKYGKNDANTYLTRVENQWFFIHNVENERGSKYANFSPVLSSLDNIRIESEEHTSVHTTENQTSLKFSISNYRTDKTAMLRQCTKEFWTGKSWIDVAGLFLPLDKDGNPIGVDDSKKRKTTITLTGDFHDYPQIVFNSNEDGVGYGERSFAHTTTYSTDGKTMTIEVMSNGVVDFEVILPNSNKQLSTIQKPIVDYASKMATIDFDGTALKTALEETVLTDDEKIYHFYSYSEYLKNREKALVALNEENLNKSQVESLIKSLRKSYIDLIDITDAVALLRENIANGEKLDKCDSLLRELLSALPYISGRSQNLTYKLLYKEKAFSSTAKQNAIISKMNKLK